MAEANIEYEINQENVKEYWDYLSKNIESIYRELWENTVDKLYSYARKIVKDTIDAFYGEYPRRSYDPKGDLYNAVDIEIQDGWKLKIEIGYDMMQFEHHQSNLFVYNNSFVEGYHGGSWGIDKHGEIAAVPYYRTPPYFDSWYDSMGPAPKSSQSPKKTIIDGINKYNKKTFIPYQKRELRKMIGKIVNKIGE